MVSVHYQIWTVGSSKGCGQLIGIRIWARAIGARARANTRTRAKTMARVKVRPALLDQYCTACSA